MSKNRNPRKEKKSDEEVLSMIKSMATVPLLKDQVAEALFDSLKKSRLKPYTEEQQKNADNKIKEIISKGIMK